MDLGIEKTRRNLIVAVTLAGIYYFAGLEPKNEFSSFFNFKITKPDVIPILIWGGVAYCWIRYVIYYFENGGRSGDKKSFDHRVRQVAEGYFKKTNLDFPSTNAGVNPSLTADSTGKVKEVIRIQLGVEHQKIADERGVAYKYEEGHPETGKDYTKIIRKASLTFPFTNSQIIETYGALISPLLLLLFIWLM